CPTSRYSKCFLLSESIGKRMPSTRPRPGRRNRARRAAGEGSRELIVRAFAGEGLDFDTARRTPVGDSRPAHQPSLTLANSVSFGWQAMRRLSAEAHRAKADVNTFRRTFPP